jgi:hypothetical protein
VVSVIVALVRVVKLRLATNVIRIPTREKVLRFAGELTRLFVAMIGVGIVWLAIIVVWQP